MTFESSRLHRKTSVLFFLLGMMIHINFACEPHSVCRHSSCYDRFCDYTGQGCSIIHLYPAKMSCYEYAANFSRTYGTCDGSGLCVPRVNFSCPQSCETNIISGCHNYTLNSTNPCSDGLCNYGITLLPECQEEEICLNKANNNSVESPLNVHVQRCLVTDVSLSNSTSNCTAFDVYLPPYQPQHVGENYNGEIMFLEYSPGIFIDAEDYMFNENGILREDYHDSRTRMCVAYWPSSPSQPYCRYSCYVSPNWGHYASLNDSVEWRLQVSADLSKFRTDNNTDNTDNTDNSSNAFPASFGFHFIVLILATLLLN